MSRTTYYITYSDARNDVLYLYDTNDSNNKFARLYQVNAALLADYVSAAPSYATWPAIAGYIPLWPLTISPLAVPPQPLGSTGPAVAHVLGGTYVAGRVDTGAITIARHDLWGEAGEIHAQDFGAVVSSGSFAALATADNEVYRGDLGNGYVYDNVLGAWLGPEYLLPIIWVVNQPYNHGAGSVLVANGIISAGSLVAITGVDAICGMFGTNNLTNYWALEIVGDIYDLQTDTSAGNPSLTFAMPQPSGLPILTIVGPGFASATLSEIGTPGNIVNFGLSIRVRNAIVP